MKSCLDRAWLSQDFCTSCCVILNPLLHDRPTNSIRLQGSLVPPDKKVLKCSTWSELASLAPVYHANSQTWLGLSEDAEIKENLVNRNISTAFELLRSI